MPCLHPLADGSKSCLVSANSDFCLPLPNLLPSLPSFSQRWIREHSLANALPADHLRVGFLRRTFCMFLLLSTTARGVGGGHRLRRMISVEQMRRLRTRLKVSSRAPGSLRMKWNETSHTGALLCWATCFLCLVLKRVSQARLHVKIR